jgi:hypothetical protein
MPRTPCGWPRHCARRWHPAGFLTGYISTTDRLLWTRGCCGHAPCSGSSSPIPPLASLRVEGKLSAFLGRFVIIPGRDHRRGSARPASGGRPGRAEPVVHRVGRSRVSPAREFRDRRAPLARWLAGRPFPLPTPATLAEAFRWEARRTVRKTATVSLQGTFTRWTPRWSAIPSGWSSTRSTSPALRSVTRARAGSGGAAPHRPAFPPQGTPGNTTRTAHTDRDRLRPPDRGHPPGRTRRRDLPHRGHRNSPQPPGLPVALRG